MRQYLSFCSLTANPSPQKKHKTQTKEEFICKLALVNINLFFKRKNRSVCKFCYKRRSVRGERQFCSTTGWVSNEIKITDTGPHFPVNITEEKQDLKMSQKWVTRVTKNKYENKNYQKHLANVFVRLMSILLVLKIEILFGFNFLISKYFVIKYTSI